MGCIELNDGISNRRIPVKELSGTIRVEIGGSDGPRVVLPDTIEVERALGGEDYPPRVCPR